MKKSKTIVITGVSTGIGYDITKSFINRGYKVFGSVRKEEDGKRLVLELGNKFEPLIFDVTDDEAIDKAAEHVSSQVGAEGIGGLVNNAGIAVGGPMLYVDMKEWRHQFDVNVLGLVKTTQAFAPLLGARKGHQSEPGRIVNISSVAGKVPMPFIAPYIGSKHAVEGISHCLRRELLLYGIDVIIIGPGAVKTPIWNKSTDMQQYAETPFGRALSIFSNKFVSKSIKTAYPSEKLGEDTVDIFEKRRPKTRYAIVPQWFTNWLVPRILPDRFLDRFLGRALKMVK
ncbi:MAG: SDR family NAD(P)-dependent oxidoreductase [Cyclobacteriaceae bacterium]|nr:SDR family NAD(P)-dependent oxidoreductase [Cyclobacteriaceae bacterium HetDA_MAG_MS6]